MDMILLTTGILLGYFLYWAKQKLKNHPLVGEQTPYWETKTKITVQSDHLPPQYYGYKLDTFTNINQCIHCHLTGLYEDLHPSQPCPKCGHDVIRFGAGKWSVIEGVKQWVSVPK